MEKILRVFLLLIILSINSFIFVSPALAVSNPNSISVNSGYVIRNISSTGDQVLFFRVNVNYLVDPTEDSEDLFSIQILDSSFIPIGITCAIKWYDNSICGTYLGTTSALTWGGTYYARLMGNPAYFTLVEGVNMITFPIQNWKERAELDSILLTEAVAMENATTEDYVNDAETYITSYGQTKFNSVIPGISSYASSVFYTSYSLPTGNRTNYTTALNDTKAGVNLKNAATGIGSMFGVNYEWGALLIAVFAFIILAGLVYSITKQTAISIIVGFSGLMLLAWIGLGTMIFQIILVVGMVIAIIFAIYFWNSRM